MWTIFCAIKRSWAQHFVAHFSGFIVMFLTFCGVLSIGTTIFNLERVFSSWGQVNQVQVYFKSGVNSKEIAEISNLLKNHSKIIEIQSISSQKAAKVFVNKFSELAKYNIEGKQLERFFPAALRLKIGNFTDSTEKYSFLESFSKKTTKQHKQIDSVSYGKVWVDRYFSVLTSINRAGWFLVALLMLATLFVSSSVIKTIIFSKRDEIEIMEFVGANDFAIYLPQVLNALFLASSAFIFAYLGTNAAYYLIEPKIAAFLGDNFSENLSFLPTSYGVILFLASVLSVLVYSVITIFNLMPSKKRRLLIKEVVN